MKHLRAKLQSEHGASILIALVFFLLCLTVGAVVLTAASTNAGRLRDQRQAEQDYQTVSSAARYLRDALSGKEFQVTTVKVDDSVDVDPPTVYPVGALDATISADAQTIRGGGTPPPRGFTVKAAANSKETPLQFDPVEVQWSMCADLGKGEYGLFLELYLSGDGDARRSPLTVTVPAVCKTSTSTKRENTTVPVRDDSGNPVLGDDGTPKTEPHERVTVTETFTVTWGEGTIRKGAVS